MNRRQEGADLPGGAIDELVTALLTASRALVGVSARSLSGMDGTVTVTQFRTLVVLQAHGSTPLNVLARRLGVNSSTALRTVDRMIAAGLAQRRANESDRREVVIGLTDRGHSLVDEVTEVRRRAIEDIVRKMPPTRRRQLVEALLAFSAAAGEPVVLGDAATMLGW